MTNAEIIGIVFGFLTLGITVIAAAGGVWWKLAQGETKLDNLCVKVEEIRKESKDEYHSVWQKFSEQSVRHDQTSERLARLEGQLHGGHAQK